MNEDDASNAHESKFPFSETMKKCCKVAMKTQTDLYKAARNFFTKSRPKVVLH